jgi:hypothetical protein
MLTKNRLEGDTVLSAEALLTVAHRFSALAN